MVDNESKAFEKRPMIHVVENSRGKQFKDWEAPCSNADLKRLGFDYWLKDLLTGPEPVLNSLCHSLNIQALVPPFHVYADL